MAYLVMKVAVTALVIALVSEVAKRSTVLGAVLASVPLVSVLAMVWIFIETKDTARIAAFSSEIVWLVLPSLVLFIVMSAMLRNGVGFWMSLMTATAATVVAYGAVLAALHAWRGA